MKSNYEHSCYSVHWIPIRNIRIQPRWIGKARKKETNKQCTNTTSLMDQDSIYVYYYISKNKHI